MTLKETLTNPENKTKLLGAAAAVIVLIGGWQIYKAVTAKPAPTAMAPIVRTVTVGEYAASNENIYPGQVRGRYESNLAFQVAGKVNSRLVNIGDTVRAGQVLMTIDPKDVNQAVEASSAQLAAAIANQKLAADNANRFQILYKNGAVSQATMESYNTQLEAANAQLRQAQAQANANGNQLSYTQLTSDADGVIAAINGEIGQVVGAGTPMVTLVRDGQREVQIAVPESALGTMKVGMPATVSFWALPNATAQGSIREIGAMADPITKTYKVCVTIENMPAEAKLGMTAKVAFAKTTAQSQMAIPATALYNVDNKNQVWIVRDKHVKLQPVEVGGYNGNSVIITGGLAQGDVIVTAGLSKLAEGQEVRVQAKANESGESK